MLWEGQRKQGNQRGGCCNIDVKTLGGKKKSFGKTLLGTEEVHQCV